MPTINFDPLLKKYDTIKYRNPNKIAPQHPTSILLAASSGLGKTNTVLNLLLVPEFCMSFDEIYLCCPSLDEPAYMLLRDHYQGIREAYLKECKKDNPKMKLEDIPVIFHHISDPEMIPIPSAASSMDSEQKAKRAKGKKTATPTTPATGAGIPPVENKCVQLKRDNKQKVVIVDDWTDDPIANAKLSLLATRNRKVNTTLICLNHNLFSLPKTFIRQLMTGYILLFPCDADLMRAYANKFASDVDYIEFKKMYKYAMATPFNFLMLDRKNRTDSALAYRSNLDGLNLLKTVCGKELRDVGAIELVNPMKKKSRKEIELDDNIASDDE